METKQMNRKLGITVGTLGALLNIIGMYAIFMGWFDRALHLESAEPGCEMLLKWIMPALTDLGVVGGVTFAIAAYGFAMNKRWSYAILTLASILVLQATWFVNVPFMAAGAPPIYFTLFWPNLILYFFVVRGVGKLKWSHSLLGMFAGMSFVLCFMNGIASWSRILTIGTELFVFVQRLHWISALAWGVVTFALLVRPRDWQRVLGLAAAVLQVGVGTPLAIETGIELGRFSLFGIAPIISFLLLFVFLSPARFRRITGAPDDVVSAPVLGRAAGKVA